MARSGPNSRPGRSLFALVVLLAIVFGWVAVGNVTSKATWSPKLGLDLEGGTEIILTPKPEAGTSGKISGDAIKEAVNIIRQRVDSSGVSEAEVTTQGAQNIVVSIPGKPDEKTLNLVKQSAALSFRPVLVDAAATPTPTTTATPTGTATPTTGTTGKATPTAKASAKAGTKSTATPKASATNNMAVPEALTKAGSAAQSAQQAAQQAAGTPTPASTGDPSAAAASAAAASAAAASAAAVPQATASAATTDASTGTPSDLAQITQALNDQFTAETCTNQEALQSQSVAANKPIITCSTDGSTKYILGPVEVQGKDIKSATAGTGVTSAGFNNGTWEVDLNFDSTGTKQFANVTARLASLTGAQNQFAIVLDGLVVSAPGTTERIPTGQAQISGGFTQASATALAQQLKFGALPVSFTVQSEDQISAELGSTQLQHGLLAGLIGLILVVLYSMLQYRLLGLVTILSLGIAGALTYGLVLLLSWTEGYRLSLAGVTGLIVAIGITADSFIVYFERVRDEVREGRPLSSAVEAAWKRARRTILASDAVSFLAALVLYFLAVSSVRGFAFTLGLTTLIDVVVVFLFTKPAVTFLSRTKFFGGGHRFSGFSPEQLGRVTAYAGRGHVRTPDERATADAGSDSGAGRPAQPGQSIAARRAAQLAAEREAGGPDGSGPPEEDDPINGKVPAGRSGGGRNGNPPAGRTPGTRSSNRRNS